MRLYTISDHYLDFLRVVDGKVPQSTGLNYQVAKPYVGVILQIREHDFLAPLSSNKAKHENIKAGDITAFKLHALGDPTDKLGIIALKYMLPANADVISTLDVDNQEDKYRALLRKQIIFIRHHADEIQERASDLYDKVVITPKRYFVGSSCNFSALMQQANNYQPPVVVQVLPATVQQTDPITSE